MKKFLPIVLILLTVSCHKEESIFRARIDNALLPYIEDFIEEASARGVLINIKDIHAELVDEFTLTDDQSLCGYGYWDNSSEKRGRIQIKNTSNCWGNRSMIERENLVFHELGHALLRRPHDNRTFKNHYPKSLMCSFRDDPSCNNFRVYYDFEPLRRYYLNELFHMNYELPEFAKRDSKTNTVYRIEQDTASLSQWELFVLIDGEEVSDAQTYFDLTKESPTQLKLTQKQPLENSNAILLRRFEISDFMPCGNLVATADIKIDGMEEGFFNVGLSLREQLPDGTFNRLFFTEITETENGNYTSYTHEMYCISDHTNLVTLSYSLSSTTPSQWIIDRPQVDIY